MEHFPQHPQKGVCNEIFITKETCPPTLNFVYCFTGFIWRGGGLIYMFVSMCFKIISKVVKYTCRLRRYNYTHDHLNTRHCYYYDFFRKFFKGGGRKIQVCPRAPDTLATPLCNWTCCIVTLYLCDVTDAHISIINVSDYVSTNHWIAYSVFYLCASLSKINTRNSFPVCLLSHFSI